MSQGRALLSIFTYDDIRTLYVPLASAEPLEVDLSAVSVWLFEQAEEITLTATVGGVRKTYPCVYSCGMLSFSEGVIAEESPYHCVDYKAELTGALFTDDDSHKFRRFQERVNIKERNNLAGRIRQAINAEEQENPEVLTFLLEMNSKLDEILALLRPPVDIEGQFKVRCVNISGGGVTFFSERDLRGVKNIYLTGALEDSSKRLHFACIGDHSPVRLNFDGSGIYSMPFDELEDDIRDEVVRFVFALERAMLKETRK